jgi:putative inorganic carbon (HCO3(-)) transporter
MAKPVVKKGLQASKKVTKDPLKLIHIFLMMAFGFVTVLTPNLNTLDSNGPKFLSLALLNLVTFLFLFTRKELRLHPALYTGFFGNAIGVVYTLLVAFSLLSFFNAFNLPEAVLHFTKTFTVFVAAYLISILIMSEKRGLLWLSVAISLLLIYDSITVFSDIQAFVHGKIGDIGKIKSSYSNKNILASAVFVKIPFALWLMTTQSKWFRSFGAVTLFMAMMAVFFMTARAFYLGLFGLTAAMVFYCLVRYIKSRDRIHLKTTGIFILLFVVSLALFSSIERYMYPKPAVASTTSVVASHSLKAEQSEENNNVKTEGVRSTSIAGRLSAISNESKERLRLDGWVRSWHVFKEHPLLGVGLGNWKIATLKEENFSKKDYTYQYKAHNDFIETATETGIFGGILFLSIFLLTGWKFIQLLLKKNSSQALYYFFLPAFGLFCYSFDAFFNFPQDRPEIQALFALYTGIAVAMTSHSFIDKQENDADRETYKSLKLEMPYIGQWITGKSAGISTTSSIRQITGWILSGLFLITLAGSSYVLYLNFKSLKLQRIIKQEINKGKLTSPANMFLEGFPAIPNLNVVGEPIAAQKARYLINEKRYDEAISILKNDHSSPYDTRPEYFLAMAYFEKKMPDSAMYYSNRVYEIKPNHFKNISILTNTMFQQGKAPEAEKILEKYLVGNKKDKEASLFASSFYDKLGNIQKAVNIIDSAGAWFPADTTVVKQKAYIHRRQVLTTSKETVDAALLAFREKRYQESVGYLNKLLVLYPTYAEAREYRAFSYFFLKEYAISIEDLNILIAGGTNRANLFNLRGVNYYNLGNRDEACKNFTIAKNMGDKDGITNYNRFCQTAK